MKKILYIVATVVATVLLSSTQSHAEGLVTLSDAEVVKLSQLAQASLKEDHADALVSMKVSEEVVRTAIISLQGEKCGLKWEDEHYSPFMGNMRHNKGMTEKQMAYIGLLHGLTMGIHQNLVENIDCVSMRDQILKSFYKHS